MQIHSLELNDFSDNNYTLIGIHSTLEEYKLAYLLNQKLNINFVKSKFSLDFENKNNNATFCIYEYENTKFSQSWFLISNQYTNHLEEISTGLFPSNEITTYLIPEKKKVDFFLKLEGDFNSDYIAKKVEEINAINQIITSYKIDPNTLKSKDFLIF
ncbi:IPExxxVDY family protein [Polaribacter uvawellassae]|uniref:IPExxxVDY family protein n=1 Tax=Polaribacter uvawellassae TaxID=3133495 RepID=UPI0032191A86